MRATALHTDLYQLTMISGYLAGGIENHRATFELFIRRLPPHRSFVIAAGLDTALVGVRHRSDPAQKTHARPVTKNTMTMKPTMSRTTP